MIGIKLANQTFNAPIAKMETNGIDSKIYEHDEITTIEFLNNLLTSYKKTEQQIEMEIDDEVL